MSKEASRKSAGRAERSWGWAEAALGGDFRVSHLGRWAELPQLMPTTLPQPFWQAEGAYLPGESPVHCVSTECLQIGRCTCGTRLSHLGGPEEPPRAREGEAPAALSSSKTSGSGPVIHSCRSPATQKASMQRRKQQQQQKLKPGYEREQRSRKEEKGKGQVKGTA